MTQRLYAVLMLDLDGCLNPWRMRQPRKSGLAGFHADGPETRIWVTAEHGQRLTALDTEIVWATSWVNHLPSLNEAASHYGLDSDLPRINYDVAQDSSEDQSGKLDGLVKWLVDNDASNAKLAWVDDQLGDRDFAWAESRPARSLLLKPQSNQGLTPSMYDQLAEFFNNSIAP